MILILIWLKNGLIKNTTTQFNENDQDIEFYFNFNNNFESVAEMTNSFFLTRYV